MEQNEKPSSIDEIFKDYKGSDHVEEVDWGKDVGNEIIPDDTDCQTAHCGRCEQHFIVGAFTSPTVRFGR